MLFSQGSYVTGFLERHKELVAAGNIPDILAQFLAYVERNSEKGRYIEPTISTSRRFCALYAREIEDFDLPVVILAFYYFCGSATQFAVTEVFRKAEYQKSLATA